MPSLPTTNTAWKTHITEPGKVFVALDTDSPEQALAWVRALAPHGFLFKVGMQLYYRAGMALVTELQQALGAQVFVDLKLHDIPNTVQQAAKALTLAGASFFNVHAQGGPVMMAAAAKGAREAAPGSSPVILAVTLLTSLGSAELKQVLKVHDSLEHYVVHLAKLAQDSGMNGVVCSAQEAAAIRKACGPDFLLVTPGIRLPEDAKDDQNRVVTPQAALAAGADYLVMGRSLTRGLSEF